MNMQDVSVDTDREITADDIFAMDKSELSSLIVSTITFGGKRVRKTVIKSVTKKRKNYYKVVPLSAACKEADALDPAVWRDANGYSNYEVADVQIGNDKGIVRNKQTRRLISQHLSFGYKKVNLHTDNGQISKKVHQLMIVGDKPSAAHSVDHIISAEKLNNLSNNLRWATKTEQNFNKNKYSSHVKSNIDTLLLEFKEIPGPGLEGYYASSSEGVIRTPDGKYLFGWLQEYKLVKIKGKSYRMHRLVCAAWHGFPDQEDMVVNHIDHDKLNNDASNLEWCTVSENSKAAVKAGRIKSKPVVQYTLQGAKIADFNSMNEAERETQVPNGSIRHCANGRYKFAGGFVWKFAE